MDNDFQRAVRIQQRIKELATFSDNPHFISRAYGTSTFKDCSDRIAFWMKEAKLDTRIDHIGNVRGKLKSSNQQAKTLVIGSHFDTTTNGNNYEGVLGILMGIEIAQNLQDKNIVLPFDVEIIAFCEKEGLHFGVPFLGSRVVSDFFEDELLIAKDQNGTTLGDALQLLNLNKTNIKADAISSQDWLGYFEINIEQEQVLYEKNIPVGIVSAIAGQKNIEIEFTGRVGHAGTEPMNVRRDALCAAAKFISGVEKYALKAKRNIVATIGKINIPDAASNVIPGKVSCTLDIRTEDEELLSDAYEDINALCEKICDKRNIYFEWKLTGEREPVVCSKKLRKLLSGSVNEKNIGVVNLVSGVGSDAAIISRVAPVAMLFVKCFKGINSDSTGRVEDYDIATAFGIACHFVEQIVGAKK
jgi:allantoate deiminase